jgi:hypothetical protein
LQIINKRDVVYPDGAGAWSDARYARDHLARSPLSSPFVLVRGRSRTKCCFGHDPALSYSREDFDLPLPNAGVLHMLKVAVGLMAFVLAGSASAAGWRSLRIDASSEDSFNESVVELREKLPRVRRTVFERSLQDIWVEGMKAAQAEGGEYGVADYLRDVDGLGYKEIVAFTDPSGDTAKRYYDQAYASLYRPPVSAAMPRATSGSWMPERPPREAGESSFGPRGGEPGVNPWQQ